MHRSLRLLLALVGTAAAAAGCVQRSSEPTPAKVVPSPPAQSRPDGERTPWAAGPLRDPEVSIGFGLRLVGGQPHAAAVALVRRLAARHLPGVAHFELDGKTPFPRPPALGIGEAPSEPLDRDTLRYFGRGIDADDEARVAKPWPVTALVLLVEGEQAGPALKSVTALVAEAARSLGAVVDDPEARLHYSAREFTTRVARGGFEGGLPVVPRHVAIHSYEKDDGTLRSVTVGMSKLGLPDLVVNAHGRHAGETIGILLNVVAQTLAERGRTDAAGRLEVDLRKLRSRTVREPQLASLKKGAAAKAVLSIAAGKREEGDAENRLMELTFEGKPGGPAERQEAVLDEIFGSEDAVRHVEHDEAVLAESARARARLLALKPAWLKGHAPGEQLMVKAPFRTASAGTEWMWVEVTRWEGARIVGLLANDPFEVPGLRAGARVEVEEGSVFDYLHTREDGTEDGNTTAKLLRER